MGDFIKHPPQTVAVQQPRKEEHTKPDARKKDKPTKPKGNAGPCPPGVCRAAWQGRECRFGAKCKFSHDTSKPAPSEEPAVAMQNTEEEEKDEMIRQLQEELQATKHELQQTES